MRVVVDSNALREQELQHWLTASKSHYAVLTDYLWMEIYKGNERLALIESLATLRNFPDQVLLLKGTKEISAIGGAGPGYANAMIQSISRAKFPETVKGLVGVERAELSAMLAITEHGRVAKAHFKKTAGVRDDFVEFLSVADALFGKGASAEIRGRKGLNRDFLDRFFFAVDSMYERLLKQHPSKPRSVRGKNRANHFMWRYALAANLLTKKYIKNGSNVPAEKRLVNDMADIMFAVYATYFNGVMTSDVGLRSLYLELDVILRRLGAKVPTHYIEHPDTRALFSYGDSNEAKAVEVTQP